MFSPDPLVLTVFDGTLEGHLRSSSEDGLRLHQPAGLCEAWGKDLSDKPLFKSVKSMQTRHFSFFFFTITVLANHSG